jgi:hypothetical protein
MTRWPAVALSLVVAAGVAACGSRPSPTHAGSPFSAAMVSAVGVQHGRLAQHRRLWLPAREPYGVHSDGRYLSIFKRPGEAHPLARMDTHNPLGQTFRLPVSRIRPNSDGSAWLKVLLPDEELGQSAWVRTDDVRVVTLRERLVVDLSSFTLRHYRDGKLLETFKVGIGRPETPTPTGTYFIWAAIPQGMPNGPYGVFALGTSAFSPVIDDGRVGVHGTANPTNRGQRVSHGCIRVYNTDMVKLERVPLGTPLVIKV